MDNEPIMSLESEPSRTKPISSNSILKPGLGRTFFLYFLILTLLPLSILAGISYHYFHTSVVQSTHQKLTFTVELKKNALTSYIGAISEQLRLQSESVNTINFLREFRLSLNSNRGQITSLVKSRQGQDIIKQYSHDFNKLGKSNNYSDIFLIDSDKNLLYSYRGKHELGLNLTSQQFEKSNFSQTVNRSLVSGRTHVSDIAVHNAADNNPALFIAQTIVDSRGELLGAIAAQVSLQFIDDLLSKNSIHDSSIETYLIGRDGHLRNNQNSNSVSRPKTPRNNPVTSHWLNTLEPNFRGQALDQHFTKMYNNADGDNVLGTYQALNFPGVNWAIVAEISEYDTMRQVSQTLQIIAVIFALTLLLIVSTALFVTRRIVSPLKQIGRWAQDISLGKSDIKHIVSHQQEIVSLNGALTNIVKSQHDTETTISSVAQGNITQTMIRDNENREPSGALLELVGNLQSLKDKLVNISKGNYSGVIEQLEKDSDTASEYDKMSLEIARTFANSAQQRWIAEGKQQLLQCLLNQQPADSKNRSMDEFANRFIAVLAKHLDAKVALLYLAQEERTLKLSGCFSYFEPMSATKEFSFGEGVIGQVALQSHPIRLNSVYNDHLDIHIGLCKIKASAVIISPFFFNDQLAGVIELAFIDEPANRVDFFLQSISIQAGEIFNNAVELNKIKTSLSQTTQHNQRLETEKQQSEEENFQLSQQLLAQNHDQPLLQSKSTADNLEDNAIATITNRLKEKALDLEGAKQTTTSFVRHITHGLRSPLKRMLVLSQALVKKNSKNLTSEQLETADVIHSSGTELLNLISDINNLAKLETGSIQVQRRRIVISELCENLKLQFHSSLQQKSLCMNVHIDDTVPGSFQGDQDIITHILRNVLSNSIKYTVDGAVNINVGLDNIDSHDSENKNLSQSIVFSVRDTGIGIPLDERNTVFDSYSPDKKSIYRDNRGASIELEISKRLSVLLDGDIRLICNDNKGCSFDIIIPIELAQKSSGELSKKPATSTLSEHNEFESAPAQKVTHNKQTDSLGVIANPNIVLIVDDDRIRINHLQEIFDESDYHCFVTESCDNLETLANLHNPAVILLNINMTNKDGSSVSGTLKSSKKLRSIVTYFFSHGGKITRPTIPNSNDVSNIINNLDKLFDGVILLSSENIKHILVVEPDVNYQLSITNTIEDALTHITVTGTGTEAYNHILENTYDCLIMELNLPDLAGDRLLERIALSTEIVLPPVITYTSKDLNEQEHRCISRYSDSIVIKADKAHQRLKQEVDAYLHTTDSNLPPAMRQRVEMIQSEQQRLNGKSVLLVDNDFLVTYPLSTALKQCGMTVVVTKDGEHCLDLLNTDGPFDVILMDIQAPLMDDVDAIKAVRKLPLHKELPIIALTSQATQEDRGACLQAGASDFITKPIDINELLSVLHIWLTTTEQKNIITAA